MTLNDGSRFNGMILALKALVGTLGGDDFFNIIQFNDKAESIFNVSQLIKVSALIE